MVVVVVVAIWGGGVEADTNTEGLHALCDGILTNPVFEGRQQAPSHGHHQGSKRPQALPR